MANPTVADIVTRARADLNDKDSDLYRYSTEELLGFINAAMFEIRRNRPDFFYGVSTTPQYTTTDISALTEFEFPQFAEAVTRFTVGRAEIRDDEFSEDGRAMQLLQMFSAAVTGVL